MQTAWLFDHFISALLERQGYVEAERPWLSLYAGFPPLSKRV